MTAPIRLRDPLSPGKMYSFNLSFGGMAVLLTVMALALTLFFILGVMVGRGHRPETAVPMVAGMMPRDPMSRPAPPEKVLTPEDLGYPDQLNHRNPAPIRAIDDTPNATSKTAAAPKPAPKPEAKQDDRSQADRKAAELADKKAAEKARKAAEKTAQKDADKAAKKAMAKDDRPPDPDTKRYDYAYQVASFPTTDEAKTYLKRVKGLGIKGDIESGTANGKPWYRVVVFFRGTPTDTRGLKAKLATLGAQKLVMRSKDPL